MEQNKFARWLMCKKWLAAVLILPFLWMPCYGQETVPLAAPSAVLMTTDGQVLFEKDPHSVREPASVTKIMTLLLVCEAIDNGQIGLEDPVTASAHAAAMGGSQIWLEEGEVLSVRELLKCVAVVSANDCAVALAEHLCGSEERFVAKMNTRAGELGMKNTVFVNACGLPAQGHVTTAYDIGLMSAALLRGHPWIGEYVTIWQDSVREGASVLNNTNKLLKSFSGITGLKTGYTSSAGYCISATAEREGLGLIAVVMAGESSKSRNADAAALLNWGFANYAAVTLTADRPLLPVPVTMGREDCVSVRLATQVPLVLERAALSGLEKMVELPESLPAPVTEGEEIGALIVRRQGGEVCRVPILTASSVEKLTLWDLFRTVLGCICGG